METDPQENLLRTQPLSQVRLLRVRIGSKFALKKYAKPFVESLCAALFIQRSLTDTQVKELLILGSQLDSRAIRDVELQRLIQVVIGEHLIALCLLHPNLEIHVL
jgi:hypothetical protein